ncbi:MAG: hypothetical protein U0521_11935 [Anaerolineae bacterium]
MPNKNMVPTLLVAGVLLFAIVAKLSVSAPNVRGMRPIMRPTDSACSLSTWGCSSFR